MSEAEFLEKLRRLSPERRAEAEAFVDFLAGREDQTRDVASARLSEAFAKLDALADTPPTAAQMQEEIDAARAERRTRHADRH